ncbi:peroxiredoxin-like family protein [Cellulophaga sp. Z1A5H]|uniref:peroxiredoxin-like family protein n=1 Tax=Cellulophaga sp. Z1A5H TaxID=2687291 RepID=UPI0013FE13B0|nr:peroxiredoxin-like family protein [Cellulophaga sp. Z1A5H]
MIRPKQQAPALNFNLIEGGTWNLVAQSPEKFTMLVFYRGLHCPVCKNYTEELQKLKSKYLDLGVEIITVSMDSEARARTSKKEWDVADIPLGYGLIEAQAKTWGLYLSKGIKGKEPDLFSEPGLFLIRPNNEVYYVAINSEPFGRPHLRSFLKSVEFVITEDYPSRGEVAY